MQFLHDASSNFVALQVFFSIYVLTLSDTPFFELQKHGGELPNFCSRAAVMFKT